MVRKFTTFSVHTRDYVALVTALLVLAVVGAVAVLVTPLEPLRFRYRVRPAFFPFACGDLLLFSGTGRMGDGASTFIKVFGGSRFTHVGVVYRCGRTGRLYVWEAQSAPLATKLTPLEKVLASYPGQVAVRPLFRRGETRASDRGGVDAEAFRRHMCNVWGVRYQYDFWLSGYNRYLNFVAVPPLGADGDRNTRFCSDLVAETYGALGVLDFHGEEDRVRGRIPRDFCEDSQDLPLVKEWRFGEEIGLLRGWGV